MASRAAANPLATGHPQQPAQLFTALAHGKGAPDPHTEPSGTKHRAFIRPILGPDTAARLEAELRQDRKALQNLVAAIAQGQAPQAVLVEIRRLEAAIKEKEALCAHVEHAD